MSKPAVHMLQSMAAGAVLYPFIGNNVIPFAAAAVLIDADHFLDYVRDTGSCDIRGVYPYAKLIEINLDKKYLMLHLFHTVEFFALMLLMSVAYPVFFYVFLGLVFHMAADMVFLKRLGAPFARAFSVLQYVCQRATGKYITSVGELLKHAELNTEMTYDLSAWTGKWRYGQSEE